MGLPNSEGKPFEKQVAMLDSLKKKSSIDYEVPKLQDIYAALLLHFAAEKERLYPVTKVYVQETQKRRVTKYCCLTQEIQSPMVVGPLGRGSLAIANVADVTLYASFTTVALMRKI
jgi:hypothetical protein